MPKQSAVAPDATPEERAAAEKPMPLEESEAIDEVLARGPQPVESRADEVLRLREEIARDRGSAPDLRKVAEQLVTEGRPSASQNGQKEPPMPEGEAHAALMLMLSAEKPPETLTQRYKIPRLEHIFERSFVVTVRGLLPHEYERMQDAALREPTPRERENGATGLVQDSHRLNRLIVAQALVDPDVRNPQLKTRFGPTAEDVVRNWFTSGETALLTARIMELSGFSDGAVVRAKES